MSGVVAEGPTLYRSLASDTINSRAEEKTGDEAGLRSGRAFSSSGTILEPLTQAGLYHHRVPVYLLKNLRYR